uniref:Serine (or cysteine) peptidase inhibitor, clade H, member 2 n=1 Tax=Oryzias latipes TaxID=8090 RepID=A0A3P9I290_ORYLA
MRPTLHLFLLISFQFLNACRSSTPPKSPAGSAPPPPPPPPLLLSDPSWALGLRLYRALRTPSGSVNTLFSPLLLASSLKALSEASSGKTSTQIQALLRPELPSEMSDGVLSRALKRFTEADGSSFHLRWSSAVFTKQAPALRQAFVKESQSKFGLQHRTLGKGDPSADLKRLGDWAKAGTGGLEGAPLEGGIKAKAGAVILANALHFKGLWEREFSEGNNDPRTFLGWKYTQVVMMHRAGLFRFHEDMENMVQVLEVPLWGGQASAVFLMPFHVENLARLDKLLSLELLSKWLERTSVTSMAISMPKANITSTLSLQKALSGLGLMDAWDQKVADFSGVSDKSKGKLHLGAVLHWASMELAPQAGEGEVDVEENVERPKLFYADHPFLVLVRDKATGALLLMGALDHAEGELLHDEL